jgi:hypothetical protein
MSADAPLKCRACHVSETFTHARACPDETGAHSRDASIPIEYENLQRPRTFISNGHTRHVGRDARAPSTSLAFSTSPTTAVTTTTTTTTPAKYSQATTATIKHKSPRASLQLTHRLRGYIRRMRSRAPTKNTKNNTNAKSTQVSLSVTP